MTDDFERILSERNEVVEQRRWDSLAASMPEPRAKERKPRAKRANEDAGDSHTIQVVEVIDTETLKRVYEQRHELLSSVESQQTLFLNFYRKTMDAKGQRVVVYQQKDAVQGFGRYHPREGTSLQGLCKPLRATLARDLYWQIDICNAHPLILLSITNENGWPTPKLEYYASHREEVLAMFKEGREEAKTTMLMLMYGGNAEARLGRALPPFVAAFRDELVWVAKRIFEKFPALVKRLKIDTSNDHTKLYSFMSRILQDREAKCLRAAIEFATSNSWKTGALLHDGFLLLKEGKSAPSQEFLAALSTHIEKICDVKNIRFENKDFGDALDLKGTPNKN